MDHRSRTWIQRRLRSLAAWELINIPLQAVIWFGVLDFPATATNIVGFALFAVLLLEGAGYWWVKFRQLTAPGSRLPGAFAVARVANMPALAVGFLFAVYSVIVNPGVGTWPGFGFALFAVLEHVNYFHLQLMYDNAEDLRHLRRHGPRRAHLARDLARR